MPMNQIGFDFKIQKKKHGSSCLGQKPNMEIERQCQQDRIWKDFCASQCMMMDCLQGGIKWSEPCCFAFLIMFVHMINIFCKSKMHLAT